MRHLYARHPAHFQGPKSLAEIFTTPLILFVAAIAGLGATYFIPPLFGGGLVVCVGGQRVAGIVIGTIQGIILSVLILPSFMKKIAKKIIFNFFFLLISEIYK